MKVSPVVRLGRGATIDVVTVTYTEKNGKKVHESLTSLDNYLAAEGVLRDALPARLSDWRRGYGPVADYGRERVREIAKDLFLLEDVNSEWQVAPNVLKKLRDVFRSAAAAGSGLTISLEKKAK